MSDFHEVVVGSRRLYVRRLYVRRLYVRRNAAW
jgi:hypothetical protein